MKNSFCLGNNWAIITGTRESHGAHNTAANQRHNRELEAEIGRRGFVWQDCRGFYKGVDQGACFFISGCNAIQAAILGAEFGQESVLIPQGLLFTTGYFVGRYVPTKGPALLGAGARDTGNYTEFDDGSVFTLNLGPELNISNFGA